MKLRLLPFRKARYFQEIVERISDSSELFHKLWKVDSGVKDVKSEFNKLGISQDTWIVLLSRLSTRGIHDKNSSAEIANLKANDSNANVDGLQSRMATLIREKLFAYVMVNFRKRIDLAIIWLNEEWYRYQLQSNSDVKDGMTTLISDMLLWTRALIMFIGFPKY